MITHNHFIRSDVFSSLAAGGGGESACAELVAAERSKHMLALRYIAAMTDSVDHVRARDVASAYETLAELQLSNPRAVECVLRHPAVGAWAVKTSRNLSIGQIREATPERLALISAAAAARAGLPYRTVTVVTQGEVVVPSLGRAVFGDYANGQEAIIQVDNKGLVIVVPASGIAVTNNSSSPSDYWQGIRSLAARVDSEEFQLAIDDFDPFRFDVIYGLGSRLTTEEVSNWDAKFRDAWSLLVRHHRQIVSELKMMLVALVPLKSPTMLAGASATSRYTFGAIALSTPVTSVSFALTLAHEVQHAKLAALFNLVDLVRPGASSLHYAPWRDDPRPTSALLQGAYAHLGVAAFWRRQRRICWNDMSPHTEYVRWRDAVQDTIEILLASPDLTRVGHRFVRGMQTAILNWRNDPIPQAARSLARKTAGDHRRRWQRECDT